MGVIKHGAAVRGKTPEYDIWKAMKQRCANPNCKEFKDYGGRGITVCAEWAKDFGAFIASVGRRPAKGLTLDRIDNSKGYEPGNVRWATRAEQSRNRRVNKLDETDVTWIRMWRRSGYRRDHIAEAFGVSGQQIYRVTTGEQWAPCL